MNRTNTTPNKSYQTQQTTQQTHQTHQTQQTQAHYQNRSFHTSSMNNSFINQQLTNENVYIKKGSEEQAISQKCYGYEKKIMEYEVEVKKLNLICKKYYEQKLLFNEQKIQFQTQITTMTQSLNELKQSYQIVCESNTQLTQEIDSKQTEISRLKKYEGNNKDIEKYSRQKKQLEEKIKSLQQEVKKLQSNRYQLIQQNESQAKIINDSQINFQNKQKSIREYYNQQLMIKTSQYQKIERKIRETTEHLTQEKRKNTSLHNKIAEIQSQQKLTKIKLQGFNSEGCLKQILCLKMYAENISQHLNKFKMRVAYIQEKLKMLIKSVTAMNEIKVKFEYIEKKIKDNLKDGWIKNYQKQLSSLFQENRQLFEENCVLQRKLIWNNQQTRIMDQEYDQN